MMGDADTLKSIGRSIEAAMGREAARFYFSAGESRDMGRLLAELAAHLGASTAGLDVVEALRVQREGPA